MPAITNNQRPMQYTDCDGNTIPALCPGVCQALNCTGASASTGAIDRVGFFVSSDVPFHIKVDTAGPATVNDLLIPANQLFFFSCVPTDVVSVIKPTGGSDGKVYVSPARASV